MKISRISETKIKKPNAETDEANSDSKQTRKSTRSLKSKSKQANKTTETKNGSDGGGDEEKPSHETSTMSIANRRTKLFKSKQPDKCEIITSSIMSSEFVYHRGFYMQIGDVVALYDIEETETIYFAQIRAFLIDQFGGKFFSLKPKYFENFLIMYFKVKSAVLTWLIPTDTDYVCKTTLDFDPNIFVQGLSKRS